MTADDERPDWLPPLPMPGEPEFDNGRRPVVGRPIRALMDVELRSEALRLYRVGWSIPEIARKLERPRRDVHAWITEALKDYVATPATANLIRGRQMIQVESAVRRVFEIIEAAGLDEIALKGIDRLVKLLQHEASVCNLDRDANRSGAVDPIDPSLKAMLADAERRIAEQEQALNGDAA
jgi:hypothetical protein